MSNNQNNQVPEEIEKLSEQLSLKLAEKLRSRQIDVAKMAYTIQAFVYYVNVGKGLEELEKFVNNV